MHLPTFDICNFKIAETKTYNNIIMFYYIIIKL